MIDSRMVRNLLVFSVSVLISGAVFSQDTAMFRNSASHSGIYVAPGVPELHGVKWSFHTQGDVVSSPAVVNGVVYVGSNDGRLYAIDQRSGAQKWSFATGSRVPSSPAVADGAVFFASYDGNFYAVNAATGKLRWKFADPGERRFAATHLHGSVPVGETMPDPFDVYLSSPVVWNGAVYFGSGDGNVYALDASTGSVRWTFKTGDVVHASPAIADGRLYIGSWDSYFYALDANTGREVWRFKTGEDHDIHNQVGIQSSATIAEGVVYFGCRDSHLYALDAATGKQRWAFDNKGSWVIVSPVVRDGKVYFATSDTATVRVVNTADGSAVASMQYHWPFFASPAIAGNTLYVGGEDGKVVAIDLAAWKPAWTFQTDGSKKNLAAFSKPSGQPDYERVFGSSFYDDMVAGVSRMRIMGMILASPVIAGNTVLVGSTDGTLYALE